MSPVEVGTTFKTGNATVAQLPTGTILQVVGPGQVRVGVLEDPDFGAVDEPDVFENGDIIIVTNKDNREGMIVRAGANLGISVGDDEVLYISDGTGEEVVRRAKKSDIKLASSF